TSLWRPISIRRFCDARMSRNHGVSGNLRSQTEFGNELIALQPAFANGVWERDCGALLAFSVFVTLACPKNLGCSPLHHGQRQCGRGREPRESSPLLPAASSPAGLLHLALDRRRGDCARELSTWPRP